MSEGMGADHRRQGAADNRTIIAVDDERAILETYRDDLCPDHETGLVRSSRVLSPGALGLPEAPTYRLLTAETGEIAVALVREELAAGRRIAAGFFDMKMPGGIDGLETIQRVRALDPDVLCCVTTAYQDRSIEEINRLFVGHEDEWDYMSKPFTQAEVRQKARSLVSSWNRRRLEERLRLELRQLNESLGERVAARTAELREANQGLSRQAAELQEAMTALRDAKSRILQQERLAVVGQLAAGVAHEINNPTTFIMANLQALQEFLPVLQHHAAVVESGASEAAVASWKARCDFDRRLEEVPEMVRDCLDGVRRINGIVGDLRSFGRGEQEAPLPVDAARAADTALRILGNEIRHRAKVIRRYAELPPVAAREAQLVQVLVNLVMNALQAMPAENPNEGRIEITTAWAESGRVRIGITDNGTGIAPEHIGRVFDPFFTTKGPGGGTGLGLSVVRNIIEKHGGSITVDHAPGGGTTVALELPVAPGGWGEHTPPPTPVSGPPPRRMRVLFVEDDSGIRRSYARFFADNHDIAMASSGAEALALLQDDAGYDVIVCDLMMPGMSGAALHQRAVAMFPQLERRFVFVTGGAFTDETRAFLERARPRVVDKPVALRDLERLLSEASG